MDRLGCTGFILCRFQGVRPNPLLLWNLITNKGENMENAMRASLCSGLQGKNPSIKEYTFDHITDSYITEGLFYRALGRPGSLFPSPSKQARHHTLQTPRMHRSSWINAKVTICPHSLQGSG